MNKIKIWRIIMFIIPVVSQSIASDDSRQIVLERSTYGTIPKYEVPMTEEMALIKVAEEQPSSYKKWVPVLVPGFTGIGATIVIGVTIIDLYEEGFSGRRLAELVSHCFWLSSAVTGVAYNMGMIFGNGKKG